jgi:hypothetical protein
LRNAATLSLSILIISSACVAGRAAPAQGGSLEAAVGRYGARTVRALDGETGERHEARGTKTFHGDVDRDGDADAVVELTFCQSGRCDETTRTSHLAVFLKGRGGYRFAAGMGFYKMNEDQSAELEGKVEAVRGGRIYVTVYGCEVDDEVCLPKYLYRAVYSLRRGRLVMGRAYARGAG